MTEPNGHIHVWASTITGSEYANAVYENEVDAALEFLAVVREFTRYDDESQNLKIEVVMDSLNTGTGMYAGVPGLVFVLTKCSGGCFSPTWN